MRLPSYFVVIFIFELDDTYTVGNKLEKKSTERHKAVGYKYGCGASTN